MNEAKVTFEDVISDVDGDYTKMRFQELAEDMLEDGRRPDLVFKAILEAALRTSLQHSLSEHRDFVIHAIRELHTWFEVVEDVVDDALERADHGGKLDA